MFATIHVFASCRACAIGERSGTGSARGGCTAAVPRRRCLCYWLCFRYIPNNSVGVVEKLWSPGGSVPEGPDHRARRRSRLSGRAAARRHALRLLAVAIPRAQGAAGDDLARQDRLRVRPRRRAAAAQPDAWASASSATTSRMPARSSWATSKTTATVRRGQRGRQRAILREGVYAINPAVFVVIAEDHVFALPSIQSRQELKTIEQFRTSWRASAGSTRS